MKGSTHSERCFDYLLDLMDPEERLQFEAQMTFDDELAAELRACEADLADFAEAKVTPIEPPPSVWEGIQDRLEGVDPTEEDVRRGSWLAWGRFVWPAAACGLLALNVWQYAEREDPTVPGEAPEGLVQTDLGRTDLPNMQAEQTPQQMEEEISALRDQVAEVSDQLVEARDDRSTQETVGQLRVLRERREELESRIESLENYYLTLAELAGLSGEGAYVGGSLEAGLGVEVAYSQNLLMGPAAGGVWDRLADGLQDSNVVLLSVSSPFAGGGYTGYPNAGRGGSTAMLPPGVISTGEAPREDPVVPPQVEEPFALAFLDKNSGQAILSLASLPEVGQEEQLVLWARDVAGDAFQAVAPLPAEASGNSTNLGVRLPEGIESLSEFMVTVEPLAGAADALQQPGERVVLQTVPSP